MLDGLWFLEIWSLMVIWLIDLWGQMLFVKYWLNRQDICQYFFILQSVPQQLSLLALKLPETRKIEFYWGTQHICILLGQKSFNLTPRCTHQANKVLLVNKLLDSINISKTSCLSQLFFQLRVCHLVVNFIWKRHQISSLSNKNIAEIVQQTTIKKWLSKTN